MVLDANMASVLAHESFMIRERTHTGDKECGEEVGHSSRSS